MATPNYQVTRAEMRVQQATPWPIEQIREAGIAFCMHGSLEKAAAESGIPLHDLQAYAKTRTWGDLVRGYQGEIAPHISARLVGLAQKALDELEDRLEYGDEKPLSGELVRVKVSARDAASIATSALSHAGLSREGGISAPDLGKLAEALRDIAQGRSLGRVIEGEVS